MSSSVPDPANASVPIRVTERGCALVLAIDRPHAGNSISLDAAQALGAELAACRDRADLRGVVITGAGERFFCTGGDVKAYRAIRDPAELDAVFGAVRRVLLDIEQHPLPVLAAINGYALGGGAELALACDLRFAGAGARIGLPQSLLGIIPGWGGAERLVRRVGPSRAMRLLLTGQRLTASEALTEGLVDVLAEGDAVAAAIAFLDGLQAAPLAIRGVKAAIRAAAGDPARTDAVTHAILERLWFSKDHREAESAFMEKRPPAFTGQ